VKRGTRSGANAEHAVTRERPGTSVAVGDLTITPIERVVVRARPLGSGVAARGEKRVVALILRRGDREWRLELPDTPAAIPT
jgi:hypothetical protein